LHSIPNGCNYFFGFNTDTPPFDDVLIRKAFIAVVDRKDLVDKIVDYGRQPALTFTPPGVFGHVDGSDAGVGIPYDPVQAQLWLAEAGHPGGGALGMYDIDLVFPDDYFSPHNLLIAEYAYFEWLEDIGVEVDFSGLGISAYIDLLYNNTPPSMWVYGSCGNIYPDAYGYLNDFVLGLGEVLGNWDDAAYLGYLNQASQTADPDERRLIYKLAEEALVENEAVVFPIYYDANGIATRPYLERTYGNGGLGGYIADWSIARQIFLPIIVNRE
jgi:oligopeptide transport system substrate-binding protein